MQGRRQAGSVQAVLVAVLLLAPMTPAWRFGALCAVGIASALDAARAQRLARRPARPPLRRV